MLDACRFDYFSRVVHEYMDGRLVPVRSPASVTVEWLRKVWGRGVWRDVAYVSASPMVNRSGLISGFNARRRFMHVEEVWRWGWSEDLATVPPGRVNLAVRLVMAKLKLRGFRLGRDYRLVAHYVQPTPPT